MFLGIRLTMLVIIVALFIFFVSMLRRRKLDLKYSLVWLIGLFGIAIICVFPHLLEGFSTLIGIETPVNTLFLICIAFLACICISLTIVVSSLTDKLNKLVQRIAITECERSMDKDDAI